MTATTRFFASCPKGLEYLLVEELLALGAVEAREGLAGVRFAGSASLGYRACLWSRLASRVLLPLAEFDARDAEALYSGVSSIDWAEHLDPARSFAIDAHGRTSGVNHSQFAAQRVKDAVVDQFRARHGTRPDVDRDDPALRIRVALRRERASVSIDLSGTPLHQRGYRRAQGEAPLKENLAVAMLLRARWPDAYAAGGALADPVCGAGTLLIEGALMAADVAPGLLREKWGFMGWTGFDATAWRETREEADARAQAGLRALRPVFFGSDADGNVLNAARQNAQAAGVAGFLKLANVPLAHVVVPPSDAPGLVIANPPYGERMGEVEQLVPLYRELGATLRREFSGWRGAIITNQDDLGRATGLRADRRYVLFNGALECVLLCFDPIREPERIVREPKPLSEGAQGLRNRIAKNLRHLAPKLRREGVSCFRAYDVDLPDYAAAIDVYGEWLHVQEYAPPKEIEPEVARRRFGEIVRVAGEVFAIPRERIALKSRRPQARGEGYQRHDERGEFIEVQEGGLKFLVNLFDYLDTGLFLDHRPVRARLRELARGTRFLNLFCYTASASVYAAAGGARSTTSVDLSATYLEWGARNLALNGFAGPQHRLVQADTISWLAAERGEYDLVFVDPPTFSNSKRAEDFDVQRDHVALLRACAERLAPGGTIVFSNNFRRFKLDAAALPELVIRDVTARTIPFDFARDQRIHHCFEATLRGN